MFGEGFFHDINNVLNGLVCAANVVEVEDDPVKIKQYAELVRHLSQRLAKEIKIQRSLTQLKHFDYVVEITAGPISAVIKELQSIFITHKAAYGKHFEVLEVPPELILETDHSLLMRVLLNMLINAFEATDAGRVVKLWVVEEETSVTFNVWNHQSIAPEVAKRVF